MLLDRTHTHETYETKNMSKNREEEEAEEEKKQRFGTIAGTKLMNEGNEKKETKENLTHFFSPSLFTTR